VLVKVYLSIWLKNWKCWKIEYWITAGVYFQIFTRTRSAENLATIWSI